MKEKIFHPFLIMKNLESLSPRENEVVNLLLLGKSNKQMALSLGVSERTIEFHLNNIYNKMQVASRVELILKLGKTTGGVLGDPEESTVVSESENVNNGNQSVPIRTAQTWRNLISLIKKEVAMSVKISFEDAENYLRNHITIFSFLVLCAISLTFRYIVFDFGLYFWGSYILLELLIVFASVRFAERLNSNKPFRPLLIILVAFSLPVIVMLFDQVYVLVVLPYLGTASVSIPTIHTTAEWLTSAEGIPCLSTSLSITSDAPFYIAVFEMLILFLLSRTFGKHPDNHNLATA